MSQTNTAAAVTGIRTVGIPVVDQDRALKFYAETLGFETRLDVPMGGGMTVSVALVRSHAGLPAGVETGIRFTTDNADAAHAALRSRGVDADDVLRWPGVPPMFAFRDQEGNGLEIVER